MSPFRTSLAKRHSLPASPTSLHLTKKHPDTRFPGLNRPQQYERKLIPLTITCIISWEKVEMNLEAQRDSTLLAIQKIIFRIIKLTNDITNKRNNDIFRHRQNGPFIYEWPDGQLSRIKVIQNSEVKTSDIQISIHILFISWKDKY